jgi:hypothetical protein
LWFTTKHNISKCSEFEKMVGQIIYNLFEIVAIMAVSISVARGAELGENRDARKK